MIEKMMRKAINLAKKASSNTFPNPRVGAVIFNKKGEILGKGYHKAFGKNHAEIEAINDAKKKSKKLKNALMCVTLEPCNHFGKTPPCSKAIVSSGIKKIFIGSLDNCKNVSGGGANYLKSHGVDVEFGVLEKECLDLNKGFFKYNKKNLPYIKVKISIDIDGKSGDGKWFTSIEAKEKVHNMRCFSDLIITGIGTIKTDNPFLNARIKNKKFSKNVLILDSNLKLFKKYKDKNLNVFKENNVMIATLNKEKGKKLKNINKDINLIYCKEKDGKIDLKDLIKKLSNYREILIEAGPKLSSSFLKLSNPFIDEVDIFISKEKVGGKSFLTKELNNIKIKKTEFLGETLYLTGRFL